MMTPVLEKTLREIAWFIVGMDKPCPNLSQPEFHSLILLASVR